MEAVFSAVRIELASAVWFLAIQFYMPINLFIRRFFYLLAVALVLVSFWCMLWIFSSF